MKNLINKLIFPVIVLAVINIIGSVYHMNYEGAVVGSVVGMIVALLVSEIRAKFD
jgi:membrane associated rhomboid family serine protease